MELKNYGIAGIEATSLVSNCHVTLNRQIGLDFIGGQNFLAGT